MDIFVKISEGKYFVLELWYFDTIREIKRKIRQYHGVPVFKQQLYDCNGRVLMDERDTEFYKIVRGTLLILQLNDPKHISLDDDIEDESSNNAEASSTTSSSSTKIQLLVKVDLYKRKFKLEMEPSDTIGYLKAKIRENEALPFTRLILNSGVVLADNNKTLSHYGLIAYSTDDNSICRAHQVCRALSAFLKHAMELCFKFDLVVCIDTDEHPGSGGDGIDIEEDLTEPQ